MKILPKVSVCIPTFNRAQYLEQTVRSALEQDYPNLEILVSDNCSSDRTSDVIDTFVADPRLKHNLNATNIGMVANWQKLIYEMATGEWFILLSDDDYFVDKSYISKAVELILSDPGINVVYASGYINQAGDDRMVELNLPYDSVTAGKDIFLKKFTVAPQEFTLCNILFRLDSAKELKAFSDLNNLYCDSQLFAEMCLLGKVGVVKDRVSVYRYHAGNLVTKKRTYEELLSICNVYFSPYRLAANHPEITPVQLQLWDRFFMRPAIRSVILNLSGNHPDRFKHGFSVIKQMAPYDLGYLFLSPPFLIKYFATKNKFVYSALVKLKRTLQ